MKKITKSTIFFVAVLIILIIVSVSYFLYPEFSEVRRRCDKIEIGMERLEVENIVGSLMTTASDMIIVDEKHIFLMDNGIDCDIDFDEDGKVLNVTSAADSF